MSGGLLTGVPGFSRAAVTSGDLLGDCLHRFGGSPARLVERDRLMLRIEAGELAMEVRYDLENHSSKCDLAFDGPL